MYNVYTTFGVLTLCYLCVIRTSNSFHSFIFKFWILIDVHWRRKSWPEFGLVICFYSNESILAGPLCPLLSKWQCICSPLFYLNGSVFARPLCLFFYQKTRVCSSFLYTPQTLFVVAILFSRCPCVCPYIRPSVTFCFLNILKSHCWIFIKPCKHVHICKILTLNKKRAIWPILLELFLFVVLNGFLYRVLCLCYYSPFTGRSTPTTAFNGTIWYFSFTM